jgi:putative cardiolipin synthase
MLEAGISLLEIERSDNADSARSTRLGSSSSSALHGKAFSVDRQQAFIGSFNFDPRSARLNTELGFVIDSPAVAGAIADAIDGRLAARAYHVRLTDTGTLQWVDQVDGKEVVHDVEPGTTLWQRVGVSLMSLLPIEWLL